MKLTGLKMSAVTALAKRVWETNYPERYKWEKLSPDTQQEWKRYCENCLNIIDDMRNKGEL